MKVSSDTNRYPWGIVDLIAIFAIAWVVLAVIMFFAAFLFTQMFDAKAVETFLGSLDWVIYFSIIVWFIYIDITKIHKRSFFKSLHFTKPTGKGILTVVLIMSGFVVFNIFCPHHRMPTPALKMVKESPFFFGSFLIFSVTLYPILEEVIFRGYVFSIFEKFGSFFAVTITAALSLFLHWNKIYNSPFAIATIFLMFITLGIIRAVSKSVILCIFAHFSYNAFLMFVASEILRYKP